MTAHRIGTVTLADTGEDVPELSILGDDRENEGYDWIEAIEEHGWGALNDWGHDGYTLGNWPYVIVAATYTKDATGVMVYGVAQYIEGDVTCRYYRDKAAAREAITAYAFGTWTLLGNGPANLPKTVEELTQELREPSRIHV